MKDNKIAIYSDRIVFVSLCLLIFFVGFSNAMVESLFGLAFVAFIVKKIVVRARWNEILPCGRLNLPIFIFIFANVLSLVNSGQYLRKSLDALFFKWLEYIIIYFMVIDTVNTKKRINIVTVILLFSLGLIGLDGIYQRISGVDFLRNKSLAIVDQNKIPAITASFNHYNDLAGYLITLLPLVICIYFFMVQESIILKDSPSYTFSFSFLRKGLKHFPIPLKIALKLSRSDFLEKPMSINVRFILAIETMLIYICLLLTFSRGGWLAFVASLIFMSVLSTKNKLRILILMLIFISIILSFSVLRERTLFTFTMHGDAQRFKLWKDAFMMIKDNPILGKGVGTFMDILPKYDIDPGGQYAHNCYLQIWAEAGIFALLSFLWFIALFFYSGIKALKRKENYLILGVLTGIFAFLVHSFFDTHLYSLRLAVMFWFMVGFGIAIIKLEISK